MSDCINFPESVEVFKTLPLVLHSLISVELHRFNSKRINLSDNNEENNEINGNRVEFITIVTVKMRVRLCYKTKSFEILRSLC